MKSILDKKDVLWIFAVKDNNVKNHYKKYYGEYNGVNEPGADTLRGINMRIIEDLGLYREVVQNLTNNSMLLRMINAKKVSADLGENISWSDQRAEPRLEEWLWKAIKGTYTYITRDFLNKNAPKEWEQWVDEERAYWKPIWEQEKRDELFALYLDLPFVEFLGKLKHRHEITDEQFSKYDDMLWSESDDDYIEDNSEIKLTIMDELGLSKDLFVDYQKRMGEL